MQRVVISGVGRSLTRMLSCSVRAKVGTLYGQRLSCTDLTTQQTNKTCSAHDQNTPETDRLRVGFVRLLIADYTLLHASLQLCAGCEQAMIGNVSVLHDGIPLDLPGVSFCFCCFAVGKKGSRPHFLPPWSRLRVRFATCNLCSDCSWCMFLWSSLLRTLGLFDLVLWGSRERRSHPLSYCLLLSLASHPR